MNQLVFIGFLIVHNYISLGLLVKQYNCDNYILTWCQLHNVTIQSDKELQSVSFPKVRQVGFLNGSIQKFSHILNLSLFKAGVLGIFARGTKIFHLTMPNTVEQLYFRDNELSSIAIEPNVSYGIKYLRIQLNKLTDISNFKQLISLIELNLCDNLIENVSFDTFSGMIYLKQLLLCANRIKTITASLDVSLPNLYHMDLSSNFLFNSTPIHQCHLPRLSHFSLRDNLLVNLDVPAIAQHMTALKILDVEHNSLDCDTYQQLLKLVQQRKIIYNVDKRACNIPSTAPPVIVTRQWTDNDFRPEDGDLQQIRQLKERLYQQVKIINSQRDEIEYLRANLSALMEQFDLVAGPAREKEQF